MSLRHRLGHACPCGSRALPRNISAKPDLGSSSLPWELRASAASSPIRMVREDSFRPSGDLLRGGEPALHPARRRRHLVRPQGDGRCGEIHQRRHDRDAPRAGRRLLSFFTCAGGDILYTDWTYAMPIFNITVFCYAVQYMVPEVARGFSHQPGKLVPSILAGFAISFVILAIVPLSVFLIFAAFGNYGGRVPLTGAGALTSDLLPAGECIRLLCDADILLGHFRKLSDEYGRSIQAEG